MAERLKFMRYLRCGDKLVEIYQWYFDGINTKDIVFYVNVGQWYNGPDSSRNDFLFAQRHLAHIDIYWSIVRGLWIIADLLGQDIYFVARKLIAAVDTWYIIGTIDVEIWRNRG